MRIWNINLINLIKGLLGIGYVREYISDPNNNKLMRHEISQYKNKLMHGCSEIYFPISGNRKLETFFQVKNGRKHGFSEFFHSTTGTIETRMCFLNDVPHGWREVFDEGGNLLTKELYDNGNIIKIKGK